MSKQRKRKLVTKIIWKTCSSLVKIIYEGENNFTQISTISSKKEVLKICVFFAKNKCKSANMGSSTVQLHGELIDFQIQN